MLNLNSIYKSQLDIPKLWERIFRGWTKVWIKDGSGVMMSNAQSTLNPILYDLTEPAILEIEDYLGLKAKYLMVNILPAGVVVGVHTDTLINNSVTRWHLPLVTNPEAWLWEEQIGFRHIPLGEWESVDFKKRHTIGNFGQVDRVHLIVDLW